jgi:hypothetical protein
MVPAGCNNPVQLVGFIIGNLKLAVLRQFNLIAFYPVLYGFKDAQQAFEQDEG